MMPWLRYKLARLRCWRHIGFMIRANFFTGSGEFWCGRCGGVVHFVGGPNGERKVIYATCPSGRALQQYQAELRVRQSREKERIEAKRLKRCDHCGRIKLEEANRLRRCEDMCGRTDEDDRCRLLVWS